MTEIRVSINKHPTTVEHHGMQSVRDIMNMDKVKQRQKTRNAMKTKGKQDIINKIQTANTSHDDAQSTNAFVTKMKDNKPGSQKREPKTEQKK